MNFRYIFIVFSIITMLVLGQIGAFVLNTTNNVIPARISAAYAEPASNYLLVSGPLNMKNITGATIHAVLARQSISFSMKISVGKQDLLTEALKYVAILQIRDEQGVTVNILTQNGTISPSANDQEISFLWKPYVSGTYAAQIIVISSFDNPEILSSLSSSSVIVAHDKTELSQLLGAPTKNDSSDNKVSTSQESKYTLLVYMVGSDLETQGNYATQDISEMMSAPSSKDVNVIIETGGAANATINENRTIDFTKVQIHKISDAKIQTLENLGNKSMGDPATLTDFLKYGVKQFPAEKYSIVLWNDGSGVYGYGHDTVSDDILTLRELESGFYNAKLATKASFELIGFDACLMATYDAITSLDPFGRYMVSSEELEPGWGWDYKSVVGFLVANPDASGLELGRLVADSYSSHIEDKSRLFNTTSDESITLSVIDLSKVDKVTYSLADFSMAANNRLNGVTSAQSVARSVIGTERFDFGTGTSSGYLDLAAMSENLALQFPELETRAQALQAAIDDAVVYTIGGKLHSKSSGISIYIPSAEDPILRAPSSEYGSSKWINFADTYIKLLQSDVVPPDGYVAYNLNDSFNGIDESGDAYRIEIVVYKEVIQNTAGQIISIFDDYLTFDSDGKFTYPFNKEFISLCNGNECVPTSMYIETSGNARYAIIPARLEASDINADVSLIYLVTGDNKFEFIGAWPGIDEDGNASRQLLPLLSGDKVYTKNYQFDIRRSANMPIELYSIEVTDSFGPSFQQIDGTYRVLPYVCDYSGNCMHSDDDYPIINNNGRE